MREYTKALVNRFKISDRFQPCTCLILGKPCKVHLKLRVDIRKLPPVQLEPARQLQTVSRSARLAVFQQVASEFVTDYSGHALTDTSRNFAGPCHPREENVHASQHARAPRPPEPHACGLDNSLTILITGI